MEINKPVTIIMLLAIVLILVFLFVIPKYQQHRSLQNVIFQKEAQYSGSSIYYARISDILSGIEGRKEVLDKIDSSLPAEFSLAPLVDFLQQKGTENGVKVTSVVFSKLTEDSIGGIPTINTDKQIRDTRFTLTATGGYQGLKNFLYAMDNSARLFEMDTVSFALIPPASGTPKSAVQQFSLKLEVTTHTY